MDEDDIKRIAEEAAEQAVKKTLLALGIDITKPEAILEAQKDMQHLRAWRTSVDTIKAKGIVTAITVLVTGILGVLWLGFTEIIKR